MTVNPYAKNQATSAEDALKIVPRAEFRVFGKDVADLVSKTMWDAKAQLFKAATQALRTCPAMGAQVAEPEPPCSTITINARG